MAAGSGGVRVDELGGSRGREAARVDILLPALGLKKRRDSSPGKRFEGDHASLRADPKVLRMLAKYDESRVLFSDFVHKINREGRPKTRILLIAGKAVYVLNPDTLKCGNRIAAERVSCVTLSTLADNFCDVSPPALPSHSPPSPHHDQADRRRVPHTRPPQLSVDSEDGSGDDLLISCAHKIELATTFVRAARDLYGRSPQLELKDRFVHKFSAAYEREVRFCENGTDGSVSTKLSEPRLRR